MKTVPGKLAASIKRISSSKAILTITASEFTPFVIITTDNPYIKMSDNTFFIEKGESREIELTLEKGEVLGEFTFQGWNGEPQKIVLESGLLKTVNMDSRW
jgi:hypothetical protein